MLPQGLQDSRESLMMQPETAGRRFSLVMLLYPPIENKTISGQAWPISDLDERNGMVCRNSCTFKRTTALRPQPKPQDQSHSGTMAVFILAQGQKN